jgi:hypothetical protein
VCVIWPGAFNQVILFGDCQMTHTIKGMLLLVTTIIIASTTFAFASSSTFIPGKRGEAAGGISGYSVANITYQFSADPSKIDSVLFTLDSLAATVKIKLNDKVSPWYNCAHLSGNNWICQTEGASTLSADTLRVFATSN